MPEIRYFKLAEEVGPEPAEMPDPKHLGEHIPHPNAGEPGPLHEFKVTVPVPDIRADGELVLVAREIRLPDPRYAVIEDAAERVFKVHDPVVAEAFQLHDSWREVDPAPKPKVKPAAEQE